MNTMLIVAGVLIVLGGTGLIWGIVGSIRERRAR